MTVELNKTETAKAQRAVQQVVKGLCAREVDILKELSALQSQLAGLSLLAKRDGFELDIKALPAAAAKAKAAVAGQIESSEPEAPAAVVGDEPLDNDDSGDEEGAQEPGPDRDELLAVCRERGSKLFKEYKDKEAVNAVFKKVGIDPNAATGPSILNDMTDEQLEKTRDLLGEAIAKHEAKAAAPVEPEEDWG